MNSPNEQAIEATARDGHEPDCAGFADLKADVYGICKSWCWGHMKCEPTPDKFFIICGECFHVFITEGELTEAHNRVMMKAYERFKDDPVFGEDEPPKPVTSGHLIHVCPICAHDF